MRSTLPALGRCVFLCVVAVAVTVLASSCTNPITTDLARRMNDDVAPTIIITSPADGSYYATTVEITGTITDSAADGGAGGIGAVSYVVLSTDIAGPAEISGPDFRIAFAADLLAGNLTVRIEAADWNGNCSEAFLTLIEGESDIPLFEATAGNGGVILHWEPVPLAESYSVYYTDNRSYPNLPHGTNGEAIPDAEPGLTVSGLENGRMHVFRLHAHMPAEYEDSYSGYVEAVPLSPLTLTPRASQEFRDRVELNWRGIPAGVEYEVYRSDNSRDGPYFSLTGPIEEPTHSDYMVAPGKTYFYTVLLVSGSDTASVPVAGQVCSLAFDPVRGSCPLPSSARDIGICSSGEYLYVPQTGGSLQVIDVVDRSNPHAISDLDLPDTRGVAVWGNYAFLSTYVVDHYEMEVYDISTPDDPVFVTGGPVTHGASECLVAYMTEPTGPGNYLYGANGSSLFVVQVDLTTGTPVLTDVTSIPTEAYDLAVAGSYLYVARDDVRFMSFPDGVAVYDLATPASPALLAQWDVDGGACAVETKDTHVYVVSPYADAKIYDATDPANPLLAASYPGSYGYALLANDILYAVNFAGVDVLDVADPTDPRLLQRYALGLDMLGQHLVFRDGYLFTAGNNVAVINDSAAVFSPITAGLVSLPHSANLVVAAGEYAYVSGTHLSVVAIGDPTAPTVLGTCDLPITPISMLAHGDIVATVGQDYQLTLVDVSDRSAPTALTTLSGPYYGVSAAGDCLLATADSGIVTLDITEPGSPVPIAIFSEAGGAASLHPMGQSVVAAGVTGISVVGAINPKNLTLEQSCSCDAFCGLDVTGSLVYMARMAPTFSLGVYDTQGETPGTPFGVFEKWVVDTDAVGNLAFVTDVSWSGDHMLYAVYASTGESLRLKDSWSFPYISGIDAAGGYLYAGFSTGTFRVLRMDPAD